MDSSDVARRREKISTKVRTQQKRDSTGTYCSSCTILNWYGWGVNAKNALYHVLAKTHVIPQVLRVRAKIPGPHTYCMMLGSKKKNLK